MTGLKGSLKLEDGRERGQEGLREFRLRRLLRDVEDGGQDEGNKNLPLYLPTYLATYLPNTPTLIFRVHRLSAKRRKLQQWDLSREFGFPLCRSFADSQIYDHPEI